MSEGERRSFEDELAHRIRTAWPGTYFLAARGGMVTVPEVRDGGMTDHLIRLAVEKAFELARERYGYTLLQ